MEVEVSVVKGNRRLTGKALAVLVLLLIVMAAAGVAREVVAGNLKETTPAFSPQNSPAIAATPEQALRVAGGLVTGARAGCVIVDDERTVFKAPAQVCTGDRFTVHLALVNESNRVIGCQMCLSLPEGFSAHVRGYDGVIGVVPVGLNTWAFPIASHERDEEPDLAIAVAVDSTAKPGNYSIGCAIEPLPCGARNGGKAFTFEGY